MTITISKNTDHSIITTKFADIFERSCYQTFSVSTDHQAARLAAMSHDKKTRTL